MSSDSDERLTLFQDNRSDAVFSDDGEYRYRLSRTWDVEQLIVAFLMLNPSTADASEDDPTIRRCVNFAKDWGYGLLVVANLFALRSTDPSNLRDHSDPVGPENDEHLRDICEQAEKVVGAWGANGSLNSRALEVAESLDSKLYALDTTKEGHPVHPLYQPADAEPEQWNERYLQPEVSVMRSDGTERSWDDLEYVTAEPPMIVREAMDDLNSGRCGVAYHGDAGRCSGDAEYKTTIAFDGHKKYVFLCEKHAGRSPDM